MIEVKREFINGLLSEYDFQSAQNIQKALEDLHGGAIKEMMEAEMNDYLGYEKSERSDSDDYHNSLAKRTYSYDAFGSLIQGDLTGSSDFGYLSNQQDPTTRFYNYGYRDYNSKLARFTTKDPIRDGSNWFAYCNGDPVNFVDLLGLEAGDKKKNGDAEVRDCLETSGKILIKKETINNTDIDLEIDVACNTLGDKSKIDVSVFFDNSSSDNEPAILSRDAYVSEIYVNVQKNGKHYSNSSASNAYETGNSCIIDNITTAERPIVVNVDITVISIYQDSKDQYNYEVTFK